MGHKLKTSKQTEMLIDRIEKSENLPWYTLARLAIALSIAQGPLKESDFGTDHAGKELNRSTVTGDEDVVYKCLVQMQEAHHLTDDEYFPLYIKAHLDRGSSFLDREQRYSRDFLIQLINLHKGI
jgi:DNA sulfur modification protein DndE